MMEEKDDKLWFPLKLKNVSLTCLVCDENDEIIDQYDKSYEVLTEIPNLFYNLENNPYEEIGLFKGSYLNRQKIIVSSDMDFIAVYNNPNLLLGNMIPDIIEEEYIPANFNIEIKQTNLKQYYCDITLKSKEFMLPSNNSVDEFTRGATFEVNGIESFQLWLDCSLTKTSNKFEGTPQKILLPSINQFKIRGPSSYKGEYDPDSKVLFPVCKWHSLPCGVRIYFNESLKDKPIINVVGDWMPYKKQSSNYKNNLFLHPYTINHTNNGYWYCEEFGLGGSWNGELGSFKTVNNHHNNTLKTIINFN